MAVGTRSFTSRFAVCGTGTLPVRFSGRPRQAEGLFDLWRFYDRAVRANQDAVQGLGAGLTEEQLTELAFALRAKTTAELAAMQSRFPILGQRMAPWLRCGYVITVDFEETIMLNPDPLFLRKLENRMQPELRAYIELFLTESPNWLEYDGELAIPWDRLRSRIKRWEGFREEKRNLRPLVSDIDRQLKIMFDDYLCGTPNSDVFDENGRLHAYARDSYERFLKVNTDSLYYNLVVSAVTILRKHGWILNRELVRLYEEHGYATDLLKEQLGQLHQ